MALWVLTMLALAAVPLLDRLLRQAGRPDLVQFTADVAFPVVALVSGATVGAVLASRRPRHPVGWLLLAVALSLTATAGAAQYLIWGLLVRPGALPGAGSVARYYTAIATTALTSIGLLLLVTPTGSLPSPRWRWWAGVMVATPVLLVVVATLAGGPLDPRYHSVGGPFDLRGHGGVLLVANQVALAVATLASWPRPGRWSAASAAPAGLHPSLRAPEGPARPGLRRHRPRARPAAPPGLQPGRGRRLPAGPPPHPADGRPALQPGPLRRRPHHRGLQHPPPPGGRPDDPDRRAGGRGRPDHAAGPGVAVAAAGPAPSAG